MRTVIVRLFEPAPDAGPVELHGFVEDVGRGTRQRFVQGTQLLAAIERIAGQREPDPTGDADSGA